MGGRDREIRALREFVSTFVPGLQYTAVQMRQIAEYTIRAYETAAEEEARLLERQRAAQQYVKDAFKVKGNKVHLGGFTLHNVHRPNTCWGETCWIHKPTEHHMRGWDVSWRSDRHMLERLCPEHGIGHPDPDQPLDDWVHGCCGCCSGAHYAEVPNDAYPTKVTSTVSGEKIA